ncbi:MAG TPA: tyrosine-type recombinase/integrase, partial [Ilumatobacteraceae bacterium]|nr:tyrosine-type recombinase/integrase [Ilumatobacteraceae bacterium]
QFWISVASGRTLAALAGLRISEIANLNIADAMLHDKEPRLFVRAGKGGKDRIIPLHPLIAEYMPARRRGPITSVSTDEV